VAHVELEGLERSYNMAAENFKNQMEYAGKKYDKYIGRPLQKFASTVGNVIATAWTSLDKYAYSDEPPPVTPRNAPTQPDGNDNRQADGTPEFNPNYEGQGKDGDDMNMAEGGQKLKPNSDSDGKATVKKLESTNKPEPVKITKDTVTMWLSDQDGNLHPRTIIHDVPVKENNKPNQEKKPKVKEKEI
jgi:hypothetical protein